MTIIDKIEEQLKYDSEFYDYKTCETCGNYSHVSKFYIDPATGNKVCPKCGTLE